MNARNAKSTKIYTNTFDKEGRLVYIRLLRRGESEDYTASLVYVRARG